VTSTLERIRVVKKLLQILSAAVILTVTTNAWALVPCEIRPYATAAILLARSDKDCTIGYAIDTDTFYIRANGSWSGLSSLVSLTGDNGGTFANGTNNMWDLSENSETVRFNLGTSNQLTLSSATGVADLLTAFDLSLGGGANALNFTAAASSITMTDNSATGLVMGSTGALTTLTFDTRDAAEGLIVTGYQTISSTLGVTGVTTLAAGAGALTFSNTAASVLVNDNDSSALDIGSTGTTNGLRYSSVDNREALTFNAGQINATRSMGGGNVTLDESDCGKVMTSVATDDTFTWTLPATIAGCVYTFSYQGAAAGALVDISPNASDGIYGPSGQAIQIANGANTACSTTCGTAACIGGFDAGASAFVACATATADTCQCASAGLSGTDDADIGITKATIRKGDLIRLVGDGTDGWFLVGSSGVVANN
jgi:hypothetical protein